MATKKTTVKPTPAKVKATGSVTRANPAKTTAYTDGRNAAAKNYPINYCPYPDNTQAGQDWKLGHRDYTDEHRADQPQAKVGEGHYRGDY